MEVPEFAKHVGLVVKVQDVFEDVAEPLNCRARRVRKDSSVVTGEIELLGKFGEDGCDMG